MWQETRADQSTCEDIPEADAVRASAMLQVGTQSEGRPTLQTVGLVGLHQKATRLQEKGEAQPQREMAQEKGEAQPHREVAQPQRAVAAATATVVKQESRSCLSEKMLHESRSCLPAKLQKLHHQAHKRQAALLAITHRQAPEDTPSCGCTKGIEGKTGATVALNPDGFKHITELCCPPEMEVFFTRLLEINGAKVCSVPHIQGLMHWFTCVPDMDPQYLLDVIKNGNPCKYWAPKDQECPELSVECAGHWCR